MRCITPRITTLLLALSALPWNVSLLARAQAEEAASPQVVGVEIVFPRDDTYQPADPFPVVFAFTGASAAWTYGFDFTWRTRRADGCEGACGVVASSHFAVEAGMFGDGGVSFGEDDAYYLVTSSMGMGPSVDYTGGYHLEWEFGFEKNCSTGADGQLQTTGGVVSASGSAKFSIQRDANPDVRTQLLDNCPLAGGAVGIQENLSGCPELGGTDVKTDPCALDVPEDVVNYVVSNLAATGGGGGESALPASSTITSQISIQSPTTMMTTTSTTAEASSSSTGSLVSSTVSVTSAASTASSTTTTSTSGDATSSSESSPSSTSATGSSSTDSSSAVSPTATGSNAVTVAAMGGLLDPVNCVILLFWGLWLT